MTEPTDELDAKNYEVGYCKPPVNTRWKTGQSGNPQGRRKKEESLDAVIRRALFEKVSVTDSNGRTRRIPKIEVTLIRQVNKAIEGDPKAARIVVDLARKSCPPGTDSEPLILTILGGLPDDIP
jgi:hypothetical protein